MPKERSSKSERSPTAASTAAGASKIRKRKARFDKYARYIVGRGSILRSMDEIGCTAQASVAMEGIVSDVLNQWFKQAALLCKKKAARRGKPQFVTVGVKEFVRACQLSGIGESLAADVINAGLAAVDKYELGRPKQVPKRVPKKKTTTTTTTSKTSASSGDRK
jgi:hypothetical protein